MNRRTFLGATASALAATTGCLGGSGRELPSEPAGDWHQYAHDRSNAGAADVEVPARGNPAWDAGDAGSIEPLVDDGLVYSVGASATAVDAKTGEQQWAHEFSAQTSPTPALTDDHLVVPVGPRVVALDREGGTEEWSVDLPRPAEGAVTADPPLVTVPLAARRNATGLVALDGETGEWLWEHPTLAARTTAISDGRVYTTGYLQDGNTGVLRALDRDVGTTQWEIELGHPDTAPVVAAGGLLVADEGTLAVHDPADGSRLRSLGSFGDRIDQPPAVADGVAYLGTQDQTIHAISVDSGDRVWRQAGSASRGISVGRDAVVVSGESLPEASLAGLAAFDRSSGAVRWEHQIEGFDAFPSTAPVLAESAVYYTSNASDGVVALGDLPTEE